MKHVIIGSGTAGLTAAKTIHALCPSDEIVVLSSDDTVHSRCMLHRFIAGERDEESLSFVPSDFFEANNIQWVPEAQVTAVHPEDKSVVSNKGTIQYDKLLIASGANSFIPPVGCLPCAENVVGMRHLADARKIVSRIKQAEKVVVIGAGLVGMDAAYSLLENHKTVDVVEMAGQVLPLNLDEHGAAAYQKLFEQNGATFHLGRKVTNTVCDDGGRVTHVVMDNGSQIACDMVVVAAGVKPAISFLEGSGIECKRAVVVNWNMQTNYPDVYAAGDVTGLAEIWPSATKQGEVAGKNMCGVSELLEDTFSYKNTINFFGLVSLSLGDSTFKDGGEAFVRESANSYSRFVVKDNKLTGLVLQGNIAYSGLWEHLIRCKVDLSKIQKPVWKLTYADFYQTGSNGEYLWA